MQPRTVFASALLLVSILASLLLACGEDDGLDGAPTREEIESQYEDALAAIDQHIEQLREDLESAAGQASREEIEDEISRLEQARDDAQAELDELMSMAEAEFNEVRDQLSDELRDLRGDFPGIFD